MEVLFGVVFAVLGGAFFFWTRRSERKLDQRIAESIIKASSRRGGGPAEGGLPRIPAVEVRNGPLTIRAWISRIGKSDTTEIAARFVAGRGPKFSLSPRSTLRTGPSLELDERFDSRFVVRTEELEQTRVLWSDDARRLMYVLGDRGSWGEAWVSVIDGTVVSDGQTVKFSRTGAFKSPDAYETAFRLISILAGAPLEVIDAEAETGRRLHTST